MDETGEKTSDQVQETHAGAYEKNMTDALSKLCRFIFVREAEPLALSHLVR